MENFGIDGDITVILADDHEVVRAGIRRLLTIDKSIVVVAEATNGIEAVELTKYHKPDLILLDILMPRMNGIEAAKEIKDRVQGTYIVMLTAFEDIKHIEQALSMGADGYLSKEIGAKDLVDSIRHVLGGERVLSKTITKVLQKKYTSKNTETEPVVITKREQEILNLVARGKSSPQIADELCISVRTVESHRYNLMQKLDVKNAAALVRYAVTNPDNMNF